MAESKTYITPGLREPELIIVPRGAVDEKSGLKLKRKAIKFLPNARGQGQYTTSDAAEQKLLDEHEWTTAGKMQSIDCPVVPVPEAEQAQATGPATSGGRTRKQK